MTLWQAASATESLAVMAVSRAITVPAIAGYAVFAYRIFWGKAGELRHA